MVRCPVCDTELEVDEDEVDEGDTLNCEECGTDLRVVSVEPLELEPLEGDEGVVGEDEDDAG